MSVCVCFCFYFYVRLCVYLHYIVIQIRKPDKEKEQFWVGNQKSAVWENLWHIISQFLLSVYTKVWLVTQKAFIIINKSPT